jgi:transcriptional regulator
MGGLRKSAKTSRERIARSQHATRVLKLRLQGLSFREIAEQIGVCEQRAYTICRQELDRLNKIRTEAAEQTQRLEIGRLDALLAAVWAKAQQGDLHAIDRVLAIMQRRAKLLGLDLADKQSQVTGSTVVLNVNEVVISRDATQSDEQNTIDANSTTCSTKQIPSE